jgi:hypothetical protein
VNDGNAPATIGTNKRDTSEHLRALKQLANVQDLQYEILYVRSNSADVPAANAPEWRSVAASNLTLDTTAMMDWLLPAYKVQSGLEAVARFAPAFAAAAPFGYNHAQTEDHSRQNGGKLNKRFFAVNFQPTETGWYKLRFTSKTNRIMGASGSAQSLEEIDDDQKINIGSMQLTVKKLRKVQQMLARELEAYQVPTLESLLKASNEAEVQAFLNGIDAAKKKIELESATSVSAGVPSKQALMRELSRKVDIYADITKLIAPNKSKYFSQNHGAMEINVRVTEPPVDVPTPSLALPREVNVFDKIAPAFVLTASPFYGDNLPQGEIVSRRDGKSYKLKFERTGQLASNAASANSASTASERGGESMTFMARTLDLVRPDSYVIRITHSAQGNSKTDTSSLNVFASRLTKSSATQVEGRMKNLYCGSAVTLTLAPDCEDRIAANQFRVYSALSANAANAANASGSTAAPASAGGYASGYANGLSLRLPLTAQAKSASLRVVWVSPYTNEEVEILPATRGDIKQREPEIDLSRASWTSIKGDAEELTLELSNIVITPATIDVGKSGSAEDLADVSLQAPTVEGVPMIVANSDLHELGTNDDGSKSFKAVFVLRGQPSKKPLELQGIVNFGILATMQNPVNRMRSKPASYLHSVNFTYTTPAKKGAKR